MANGFKLKGCHHPCDCDKVSHLRLSCSWYARSSSPTAGSLLPAEKLSARTILKCLVWQMLFGTLLPRKIIKKRKKRRRKRRGDETLCKICLTTEFIKICCTSRDPELLNVQWCFQLIPASFEECCHWLFDFMDSVANERDYGVYVSFFPPTQLLSILLWYCTVSVLTSEVPIHFIVSDARCMHLSLT